jgi:hypothetical protein
MLVRWSGNLGLLLINSALLWFVYPGFGIGAAIIASGQDWGVLRQVEMPYWLQFLLAIVLLDLGHFGIHYLFHRIPALWRMHCLHHTDPDFERHIRLAWMLANPALDPLRADESARDAGATARYDCLGFPALFDVVVALPSVNPPAHRAGRCLHVLQAKWSRKSGLVFK